MAISSIFYRQKSPCVLIADNTLIAKTRSKKIEMVHYQYSGNQGGRLWRRLVIAC
nr:hypothetical protein [Candidatus Arsenophonus triatominarum]